MIPADIILTADIEMTKTEIHHYWRPRRNTWGKVRLKYQQSNSLLT